MDMEPKVFFETKGGGLEAYSSETGREIILAAAKGEKKVSFSLGANEHVCINFEKMRETSHTGGKLARKVVIKLPWNKKALAHCKMDDENKLQTQLIMGLVQGLAKRKLMAEVVKERLKTFPPGQKLKAEDVRANPNLKLQPASARLQKFVKALIGMIDEGQDVVGEMLDILCGKVTTSTHFDYMFHGTRAENRKPILENGLSRAKQRSGGFYVAMNPATSFSFCNWEPVTANSNRAVLLLILELKVHQVPLSSEPVHIVSLCHPERLLPIGEVSFISSR